MTCVAGCVVTSLGTGRGRRLRGRGTEVGTPGSSHADEGDEGTALVVYDGW